MSGDPEAPLSDSGRDGQPRQNVPAASPPPLPPEEARRERSAAAAYAGIGFQFAIAILVFGWLGDWLDGKFGTAPLFLSFGVFLGGGAAFYSMYRQLMGNLERDEAAKRARESARADASPVSSPRPSSAPPRPDPESRSPEESP
jgi:F0F1-type ATP synthase assembly protein I